MRTLLRLLFLFFVIAPLALLGLAWFTLAPTPEVAANASLSHQDIARAEKILRYNDPRRLPSGTTSTATLSAADINLAVGYLLKRAIGADSEIQLTDNQLAIRVSRQVPLIPVTRFMNTEIGIGIEEEQPTLVGLRIGPLNIPTSIARQLGNILIHQLSPQGRLEQAIQSIGDVQVSENHLRLSYRWNPRLIDDARESLLTDPDLEAIRFYHDRIVELQRQGIGTGGSLSALLKPLFSSAQARSRTGNPVTENTALLSVLAAWAGRRGLHRLVPGNLDRPGRFRLRLRNRIDFAQHFLVSAALAARGDSLLSNAVGVFKEIVDTDRGSGFSFTDIAADLSGSRFGELATGDEQSARRIQSALATGIDDADLLPEVGDLPEFLNAAQFEQRFQQVGSPTYEAMMADITARIAALPIYRE